MTGSLLTRGGRKWNYPPGYPGCQQCLYRALADLRQFACRRHPRDLRAGSLPHAGGDGTQTGGDLLETITSLATHARRASGVERNCCFAHQHGRRWPGKGTGGTIPHRSDDWALRPVNNILCDGHPLGRHEWVTTMCATANNSRRRPKGGKNDTLGVGFSEGLQRCPKGERAGPPTGSTSRRPDAPLAHP